ncbi:retrovirus-related pol polyprotein from transposon TNT 1-94 [Tanacetum coccineum]
MRYRWKPTGRTFTINGNTCPLTRITSTKVEPLKETTSKSVTTPNREIKIYCRKTKVSKSVNLSNEHSILGSMHSNILEPNKNWGSNALNSPSSSLVNFRLSKLFSGTVKFRNDQIAKIMGYGKSKKSSHKPKVDDTNPEKLYLLHMDLCGPMRVESIHGKKYILVINDDYSRFTWVKFLKLKDKAPESGVVERWNYTFVEAGRTILIFSKAPLYLWAEAVSTTCYTQNRPLIRLHYNKTPYELMHEKKPDLSFLHVFGSLCYPTNDREDLGKLKPKADKGIFVGYAPAKKAF